MCKYDTLRDRCESLAEYLVTHQTTVRDTAKHFGISKSTVHKDIRERLKYADPELYISAVKVLDKNKRERHIRGGLATKNKYSLLKYKTK